MLKIITRSSPLALIQSKYIGHLLQQNDPSLQIEYIAIQTIGDQWLEGALNTRGGKGLFVSALEEALLNHQADLAVHSCKDMPAHLPQGLITPVICDRRDPSDAWLSTHFATIEALPPQAIVGTASLRRTCQIRALRPDVRVKLLRGNVGTRLKKLDQYDGIILATAGLERLNLSEHIRTRLPIEQFLPAPGQGALVVECREADQALIERITTLNDSIAAPCVMAEQAFSRALGGGCHAPIASHAIVQHHTLILRGMVGATDGTLLTGTISGDWTQAMHLGALLADQLKAKGADRLLERHDHHPSD